MVNLQEGVQYIIMQGTKFLFDGVYEGNIHQRVYLFNGGHCCTLRLTAEEISRLTFTPTIV